MVATVEFWMFLENRLIASFQLLAPRIQVAFRQPPPRAFVTLTTSVGPSVRHRLFNSRADGMKIIGKVASVQISLNRHHAAANIYADRRRDDGTLRRYHAAHSSADAPVDVRHSRYPFEDERKLGNVQQLFASSVLEGNALHPCLDGNALLGFKNLVTHGRSLSVVVSFVGLHNQFALGLLSHKVRANKWI
jgi:hypothetical protein